MKTLSRSKRLLRPLPGPGEVVQSWRHQKMMCSAVEKNSSQALGMTSKRLFSVVPRVCEFFLSVTIGNQTPFPTFPRNKTRGQEQKGFPRKGVRGQAKVGVFFCFFPRVSLRRKVRMGLCRKIHKLRGERVCERRGGIDAKRFAGMSLLKPICGTPHQRTACTILKRICCCDH